jgi:chromosome segregation ATPase
MPFNLGMPHFWSALAHNSTQTAVGELIGALNAIMPDTIEDSQVDASLATLVDIGVKIGQLERRGSTASTALRTASADNAQRIAVIEYLQKKVADSATSPAERAATQKTLETQLAKASEVQDQIDLHAGNRDLAKDAIPQLRAVFNEKLNQLKNRKATMEAKKTQLDLAQAKNSLAHERTDMAVDLAKLKHEPTNPVDRAAAAMDKKIAALNDETASLDMVAKGLAPEHHDDDPILKEALAAVGFSGDKPEVSNSDRLAEIKARMAKATQSEAA